MPPSPDAPRPGSSAPKAGTSTTRVLVVDDSALFRRFIYKSLEGMSDVEVVGFATNGRTALDKLGQYQPDVVTLDVEMPVMDGLETLRKLKAQADPPRVIMLSGQSGNGADFTIRALELGADDFVLKPSGDNAAQLVREMGSTLGLKIRALASLRRRERRAPGGVTTLPPPAQAPGFRRPGGPARPGPGRRSGAPPDRSRLGRASTHEILGLPNPRGPKHPIPGPMGPSELRDRVRPLECIVLGVSTGGPQALAELLPHLPGNFRLPIAVVQHMPPKFTASLAQSLDRKCALAVKEAESGDRLTPGNIFIAPGGRHMKVIRDGYGPVLTLTDDPPEQACRPAVNHLFWSAAETYGKRVLGVVLTGMGEDGLAGGQVLVAKGATVIAQDEASCTVWGMPKRVAEEGVACATYPLDQIAAILAEVARP